ncbi:ABC transporter permease [Asanoa ishikariensis]|uniref:Putative ABC transport system permease protein n=1 Tax=Asanoa ishikariensis TaxID=137265 RepID=A0A1H3LL52_9ACTN|nr:ABC transporter permease [Asanoa ishikariensis]GIF65551.1 ABC transporter permease [Asanoa ishikariensis]SDY65103.1 putative ABC transport system permease protein [Asanoa ishikariensis]
MLSWSTVRERWTGFVGSFIALTLGVGVLTASLVVFVSAQPAVPDRLAGAAVIVQSPAGGEDAEAYVEYVPWSTGRAEELAASLRAVPGVAAAVPDRSFYAQLVSAGRPIGDPAAGDPLGHGWSTAALAPYRLVAGAAPSAADEVVLDAGYGLAPGDSATVLTATGPRPMRVSGTVDGPGIYVSDASAVALAPGVRAIGLVLEPAAAAETVAAAARAKIGGAGTVVAGDARTALEPEAVSRTRWLGTQLITVMVLLAAFATVFVMASTAALNAYQRRRELALLRAIGATPRQTRRLLLGEALVVGVVSSAAGAALGMLAAPWLGDLLVRAELEPAGFTPSPSLLAVGPAVLTGVVVAVTGAWAAARRAARVRPLEALRDAAVDRRAMTVPRWVFGGLCGVTGLALAVLTPMVEDGASMTTAIFSALALIVAITLFAPVVIPPALRALTLPLRRSATGEVVRENAGAAVRRTAATAGPVLLTVGFAVLILGMVKTMSPAFGGEDARALGVDVVVTADGTPGLSDTAVAGLPGTVLSGLSTQVFVNGKTPSDALGVVPGAVPVAGDAAALAAGTVVVADPRWRPGDTLRLTFADGEIVPLRVAASVPPEALPTPLLLPRDLVRQHDPSALTQTAYVRGAPVSAVPAGLGVLAQDPLTYSSNDDEDGLVWIFVLVMVGMSVGYTSIAVANTLVMATGDRRRDFRVLRLSGATNRQILRMVGTETALVVLFGTAVGFLVALPALFGIRSALAGQTGADVRLILPWPELSVVVAVCAVLALGASLLATRRTLHRVQPR